MQVGTKPGQQYDKEKKEESARKRTRQQMKNNARMLHNAMIVNPGKGDEVGRAAMEMGLNGSQLAYVPASKEVPFNTCLLEPGKSQSIYFIAPRQPGDYTYVCTFPGHYAVMK